ncbi:hypothetical protein ACE6H2_012192 [Prunus campanulata]
MVAVLINCGGFHVSHGQIEAVAPRMDHQASIPVSYPLRSEASLSSLKFATLHQHSQMYIPTGRRMTRNHVVNSSNGLRIPLTWKPLREKPGNQQQTGRALSSQAIIAHHRHGPRDRPSYQMDIVCAITFDPLASTNGVQLWPMIWLLW